MNFENKYFTTKIEVSKGDIAHTDTGRAKGTAHRENVRMPSGKHRIYYHFRVRSGTSV